MILVALGDLLVRIHAVGDFYRQDQIGRAPGARPDYALARIFVREELPIKTQQQQEKKRKMERKKDQEKRHTYDQDDGSGREPISKD